MRKRQSVKCFHEQMEFNVPTSYGSSPKGCPLNTPMSAPGVMARKGGEKLAMVTAYDYPTALLAAKSGMDIILVGDSLGMVVLGHDNTLSVTMDIMVHHCLAASKGAGNSLLVADLPFGSYQESTAQAVRNAARCLSQGHAQAVKLEGAAQVDAVRQMVSSGIPVQGHVGLTPQHVAAMGGFKVQGKTAQAAQRLLEDALRLQDAGCFSIVIEGVPSPVGAMITKELDIPTIGIGAGPHCDGQVLVMHDLLGLFDRFTPKFVKRYAELGSLAVEALQAYRDGVRTGQFPGPEHQFAMPEGEKEKL